MNMARYSLNTHVKEQLHRLPASNWTFSLSFMLRLKLRCRSVVMLQDPSAALAAPDRTPQRRLIDYLRRWLRAQRKVNQGLMRALRVVVHQVLPHPSTQAPYAQKGQTSDTIDLHAYSPPFGVRLANQLADSSRRTEFPPSRLLQALAQQLEQPLGRSSEW